MSVESCSSDLVLAGMLATFSGAVRDFSKLRDVENRADRKSVV